MYNIDLKCDAPLATPGKSAFYFDCTHHGQSSGDKPCCGWASAVCGKLDGELPSWALGQAIRHTDSGAQLCTRDGRSVGNAVIVGCESHQELGIIYLVLTDAGNLLRMTNREILEMFHLPNYVMDPEKALGWKNFDEPVGEDTGYLPLEAKPRSISHNLAALVFREQLMKLGITVDGWDAIIYRFAAKYNGASGAPLVEAVRAVIWHHNGW